jgi:hypothetical protein
MIVICSRTISCHATELPSPSTYLVLITCVQHLTQIELYGCGCEKQSDRGLAVSTMTQQHHSGSSIPQFSAQYLLIPKVCANNFGGSDVMVDLSATAYELSQTFCICMECMWEPFHVGLGPQPIHPDIICSPVLCCGPGNQTTPLTLCQQV